MRIHSKYCRSFRSCGKGGAMQNVASVHQTRRSMAFRSVCWSLFIAVAGPLDRTCSPLAWRSPNELFESPAKCRFGFVADFIRHGRNLHPGMG